VRTCNCARLWPGVVILLSVLTGCGGSQVIQGVSQPIAGQVSSRQELQGIPFFPQQDYQCGPAALATALQSQGIAVTPEQLTDAVFLPKRKGSLQIELVAAARSHGMVAYPLAPGIDALVAEIDAGNPVLVLQNLGLDWWPQWHYAVAVGYNLDAGILVLRSGATRRHVVPLATFDRTWRRGGRWALVILPPGKISATAEPFVYSQAVHDLELAGQSAAALIAFRAAARRWPRERIILMAWGNAEYASGSMKQAEKAFRQAVLYYPKSADALNNLAYALAARSCRGEALQAIACAQALAPTDANIRASAEELMQLSGEPGADCQPVACARAGGRKIKRN